MAKMLVVYYSWSNGNTERIAKRLAAACDAAALVKIETVTPYSGSYEAVVAQGKNEVEQGYLPEIKLLNGYDTAQAVNVDLADYDIIAIGTPTWWYTYAPAVASFLQQHDWNGKTVVPFQTDGGWPGHLMQDIKKACKGAMIRNKAEIRFDSDGGAEQITPDAEIQAWIRRFNGL